MSVTPHLPECRHGEALGFLYRRLGAKVAGSFAFYGQDSHVGSTKNYFIDRISPKITKDRKLPRDRGFIAFNCLFFAEKHSQILYSAIEIFYVHSLDEIPGTTRFKFTITNAIW